MASRPDMRASDSDRERVSEILRDAHGDGRLGQEELLERLDAVYEARTYHDLDQVIEDLPLARRPGGDIAGQIMRRPRSEPKPPSRITVQRVARTLLTVSWWMYGATVALSMMIWLLVLATTDVGAQYFWPLWVAGPWGVLLGAGELAYRRRWPDRSVRP
ncbi:DUF1707 SHOCT-like domain-containing protein [Phytoactinopolyspora mesophila]|uniref:DUF1707 domain-containing protein n=1 Tax=Phytoactinopolyspora mesophila TaxID=2650750 RepID=A0A7K3M3H7_9ACTN|nr:DUF1707 domain-containing protein [Phytoactinopolyspora mesophila]NDL57587.1 DUF1707 domain-containing protein [Phytoactinopolyspora mesophila]